MSLALISRMPNMKTIISPHNKKLPSDCNQSKNSTQAADNECNCRKKILMPPLEGKCLTSNVVYQATVTTETSTVIRKTRDKERYRNHTSSFRHQNKRHETELSNNIRTFKDNNKPYSLKWKTIKQCKPHNKISKNCNLSF